MPASLHNGPCTMHMHGRNTMTTVLRTFLGMSNILRGFLPFNLSFFRPHKYFDEIIQVCITANTYPEKSFSYLCITLSHLITFNQLLAFVLTCSQAWRCPFTMVKICLSWTKYLNKFVLLMAMVSMNPFSVIRLVICAWIIPANNYSRSSCSWFKYSWLQTSSARKTPPIRFI